MKDIVICCDVGSLGKMQPLFNSIHRHVDDARVWLICDEAVEAPVGVYKVGVLQKDSLPAARGPFSRITVHTYYRLYIDVVFPELSQCLYLDFDTLVVGDISSLWDKFSSRTCCLKGYSTYDGYVNAGVLFFRFTKACKAFLVQARDMIGKVGGKDDQDIINTVFRGHIEYFGPEYNTMVCGIPFDFNSARILHYMGKLKPWDIHPCFCRWFDYV